MKSTSQKLQIKTMSSKKEPSNSLDLVQINVIGCKSDYKHKHRKYKNTTLKTEISMMQKRNLLKNKKGKQASLNNRTCPWIPSCKILNYKNTSF